MADKGDPQDKVMEVADLKMKIKRAKDGPIMCAFGLTKEKVGLLFVDPKAKKAKKARDKLKKDAGDIVVPTTIRFGTVVVKDDDPTTLSFTVNKAEVGGTIIALVKLAKKIGFTGIVINPDEGLENESEEEESQEQQTAPPPPPPPSAQPQAAPPPPPPPPPPGQPQAEEGTVDWAAREHEVGQLAQRMVQLIKADSRLSTPFSSAIMMAQTTLKNKDDEGNQAAIRSMRDAIESAPPPPPPPPPGQVDAVLAKSAQAWTIASTKMSNELDVLCDAITAAYEADGLATELKSAFDSKVARLRSVLGDQNLVNSIRMVSQEKDVAARSTRLAEAKQVIANHSKFFSGEALLADLDNNPFRPLKIQATMTATLAALEKAVH